LSGQLGKRLICCPCWKLNPGHLVHSLILILATLLWLHKLVWMFHESTLTEFKNTRILRLVPVNVRVWYYVIYYIHLVHGCINVRCMLYVKAVLVLCVTDHDVFCSSTSILQPRHGCPLTSVARPQVGKLAVVATTQQPSVAPAGTKLVTLRTTGKIVPDLTECKMVPLYSLQISTCTKQVYFN